MESDFTGRMRAPVIDLSNALFVILPVIFYHSYLGSSAPPSYMMKKQCDMPEKTDFNAL